MKAFIVLIMLTFGFTQHAQSQKFQLLLYGNQEEPNGRGCDRKEDVDNMYRFFKEIANTLGYEFTYKAVSGKAFTAERAKADIAALNVGNNDIVVFYYTGHGYNQNIDDWPSLAFNDKSYHSTKLLDALSTQAAAAKLIVFITDCCNKPIQSNFLPEEPQYYTSQYYEENVKSLFTNFTGKKTVRLTASSNGEYSYSGTCGSRQVGAYFGRAFREMFKDYTYNRTSVSWNEIIEGSKQRTKQYIKQQEPIGNVFNRKESKPALTQQSTPLTTQTPSQPSTPITTTTTGKFYVHNAIGGQQTAEDVIVTIGSISKRIMLEGSVRKGTVSFSLPDGTYNYLITSSVTCEGNKTVKCVGNGSMTFKNGKTYAISTNSTACKTDFISDLYLKEM